MANRTGVLISGLALTCGMPSAFAYQSASDWEWVAGPYVWAAGVSTDMDVPPIGTDSSFSDLIDKLDGAFLGRIEGQNERFGVMGDIVYLGLADSKSFERFETSSDLDTTLIDVAGVWSPGDGRMKGIELLGGLRYIDVDFRAHLAPNNTSLRTVEAGVDRSFSDALIGARYIWQMTDRWSASVRGDGSFGDTDGTWSAAATAAYRMKSGEWMFGYRYLSVELENDRTSVDIRFGGVLVGYGFRF